MESNGGDASTILRELENLKSSKIEIERRISVLEAQLRQKEDETKVYSTSSCTPVSNGGDSGVGLGLSPEMIYGYSRHLLLPSVGVQGQSNLLKTSILVVGAGGLGSPALLYLAACGVGRLGIVDHDVVELNNLHRQAQVSILTVYNYDGGPCYRCLFPTPPPATCQRCSDSGVLEVVPGIIGCLQALEAIKIASAIGEPLSGRMLLLDALSARIRISPLKLNLLPTEARISCKEFNERVVKGEVHVLVDVRPAHHFKIVSLPKSMNIPLSSLAARLPEISSALKQEEEHDGSDTVSAASLYVVCRRGNDSQRAIEYLRKMGFASAKDIVGGLESWACDVDPNFPTY